MSWSYHRDVAGPGSGGTLTINIQDLGGSGGLATIIGVCLGHSLGNRCSGETKHLFTQIQLGGQCWELGKRAGRTLTGDICGKRAPLSVKNTRSPLLFL